MKQGDVNMKRFVRALKSALEDLSVDAKCYGYRNDPSYLELKTDLQYTMRMVEHGEEFAGKLLFKNIQNIAPNTALRMANRAKTEQERLFFIAVAQMNEARIRQTDPNFRKRISIFDNEEPVLRWNMNRGILSCPYCDYGSRRREYVNTPHKFCPDCGKRLKKPIIKKLIRNAIRCNLCGDEVESTSVHHNARCKCGSVSADGGLEYLRRSGNPEDFIDISEYVEIDLEEDANEE